MKIKSNIGNLEYDSHDAIRIINQKQWMFYVDSGLYPIDLYPSYDEKTDRKKMVFVFERNKTKELYQRWCDYDVEI
jgi:hypothetical protein